MIYSRTPFLKQCNFSSQQSADNLRGLEGLDPFFFFDNMGIIHGLAAYFTTSFPKVSIGNLSFCNGEILY